MLLKDIELDESSSLQNFRKFVKSKYFKPTFFLIVLLSASFFFQSSIKTYKISNYALYAKGIIENNLKIIPNYFSSFSSNPETLYIDMKSLNTQKLAYLRQLAITNGNPTIPNELKEEEVNGRITYKGQAYKASLALTGQNMDHISHPYKWSYRIKIKGNGRIDGIKKFTLLVPHTRGSNLLSEFIGHKLMKYLGLIGLRYDFKKVIFNGKDHGIYAFEEHLDKRTLESNMLREGIMIKATPNSFKVFKQNDMESNEVFSKQIRYLEEIWQSFLTQEIELKSLFDIDKMAKYYALSDIINGQHTHFLGNEFFHFNPMTNLLEPIGREWDAPYISKDDFLIFMKNISVVQSDVNSKSFQDLIFNDEDFIVSYLDSLDELANKDFLNKFLEEIKDEIASSKAIVFSEYPYLNASEEILFEQLENIRKVLDQDHSAMIEARKNIGLDNNLIIFVKNMSPIPAILENITLDDFDYDTDIVVPPNSSKFIDLGLLLPDNFSSSIKIRMAGQKKQTIKNITESIDTQAIDKDLVSMKLKDIEVNNPQWIIDKNIIIHKNQTLTVGPGTIIDMINGAGITSYGNVVLKGSEQEPIVIQSTDGTGVGISVVSAKERSSINYTIISGLTSPKDDFRSVTSPVFFYESDVDINNCIFKQNISEDALNIFRSNFSIRNSRFIDIPSDAFDSDFSIGEIVKTSFINLGNDAIDLSGSTVNISDIRINGASDKAISLGEESISNGSKIVIENSNLGISSKDLSFFAFKEVEISKSQVAVSLYQKKEEFGPSMGVLSQTSLFDNKLDFIIENDSSIEFNTRIINGDFENVKDLMYGNVYGTATAD